MHIFATLVTFVVKIFCGLLWIYIMELILFLPFIKYSWLSCPICMSKSTVLAKLVVSNNQLYIITR